LKPESEADEAVEAGFHTQEITEQNRNEVCTPASGASSASFDGGFLLMLAA
jgi:hypothetical protein